MIALDTETTGLDFWHGCRPFFVSTCYEDGTQKYWEWDVDPLTRIVQIPEDDIDEIQDLLDRVESNNGVLVLQNPGFDVHALRTVGVTRFPWGRVRDTLLAGHLLRSNGLHNLTDMVLEYLGEDIEPYEVSVKESVNEARRLVRTKGFIEDHGEWRIGSVDDPEIPSGGSWRSDYWLPRAVARRLGYSDDHPWWTVLKDYANADTSSTLALWKVQESLIEKKDLGKIYSERLKCLPIAYRMESNGVTVSESRTDDIQSRYRSESDRMGRVLVESARGLGYDLTLPKNGINNSLRGFLFGVLDLPKIYDRKSKTAAPTLNRTAIDVYLGTLPEGPSLEFVRTLVEKRSRDTAVAYLDGYRRFWRPTDDQGWSVLHPRLNPTGTDTLRWSSSNPNEQNISKREGFNLKYVFGPAPGREWWSLDAKNIELRIPAYLSGEPGLVELFDRPDDPPFYGSQHLLNFSIVYPDLWRSAVGRVGIDKAGPWVKKEYESTWYRSAKIGGLGMQYGAQRETSDRAFRKPGSFDRIKSQFDRLESLNQRCIRTANETGYVETVPDRTVDPDRGYPLYCAKGEYGRVSPTVPLNYVIQGTATWWIMKAMIRVQSQLDEWNSEDGADIWRMVLQVHDEIVLDFPKGRGSESWRTNLPRIRKIRYLMEEGGRDIGIPTPVGIEYALGDWGTGVSIG